MAKKSEAPQRSNVSSEVWAEALAVYEADKALEDRARGVTKKHQLMFESQGIPTDVIRERYKESKLSEDERTAKFAIEQVSRRALDLWSASSPEDFERLIERASQTQPATGAGADKLAGARSYNDGFNSARHGGGTLNDNPCVPGTETHVQWARGCKDGIDYNEQLEGTPLTRETPAMGATNGDAREDAPKKARGRPRKAAGRSVWEDPKPNENTIPSDEGIAAPPASMFEDDLPAPPGMPE